MFESGNIVVEWDVLDGGSSCTHSLTESTHETAAIQELFPCFIKDDNDLTGFALAASEEI